MDFTCQKEAIEQLKESAENEHHSLMIEGISGSGKTYLACLYSRYIHVDNVQIVKNAVTDIRDAINLCWVMDEPVLLCIENLDQGVKAASYTLLKFLEEPKSNVYIVVTCRDRTLVPDTILSRSVCITINNPTELDLDAYANRKNSMLLHQIKHTNIYRCARSFSDIDTLFAMSPANMKYLQSALESALNLKESVNSIVWKITHFEDGSEMPLSFVLRYLMMLKPATVHDLKSYRRKIIDCMNDLERGSIGTHAVVSKFAMDLKYGD